MMASTKKRLWTKHNGKGFYAQEADYADRVATDLNGNSLQLTVQNSQVTKIGGKTLSAKNAETDINGNSLELTILNNERVTKIGGLTVGADSPDLSKYYYHDTYSKLNVSFGNDHFAGKLIQTSGNMNNDDLAATIATDWGGSIRTLVGINTTNKNYSYLIFGLNQSNNGRRFLLPTPVANKYAKTDSSGNIIWGDIPSSLPSSTTADENKLLRVNNEGNPVWSQLSKNTFGLLTSDDGDEIQDEDENIIGDDYSTELWASYNGIGIGAERAIADADGNNIADTYVKKGETSSVTTSYDAQTKTLTITL